MDINSYLLGEDGEKFFKEPFFPFIYNITENTLQHQMNIHSFAIKDLSNVIYSNIDCEKFLVVTTTNVEDAYKIAVIFNQDISPDQIENANQAFVNVLPVMYLLRAFILDINIYDNIQKSLTDKPKEIECQEKKD